MTQLEQLVTAWVCHEISSEDAWDELITEGLVNKQLALVDAVKAQLEGFDEQDIMELPELMAMRDAIRALES